jgi:predicted ATPase/DNA-binding CsgD family transcriptional regulator
VAEPALESGNAVALPLPLTRLVGRDHEIASARARLAEDGVRLLTLLGPGGSGKTRLAGEVARRIADEDGIPVAFVDLSTVRDAAGLLPALARALVVPESAAGLLDAVGVELRRRGPLLVLDNLEQIPGVAGPVGALLRACPALTILATSRTPVRLSGEQRWPLAPLPLPGDATLAAAQASPAVALFVARARLVRPDFALTEQNAAAVAAVCRRLDWLPLAIELAAARVRLLSPAALLARLNDRLTPLASGADDLPDRQRTMRETVAWSEGLLSDRDRRAFHALAIFSGSFALPAAVAVVGADAEAAVERLLDQSLLAPAEEIAGEPRVRMLETVRDVALGSLDASGARAATEDALAAWASKLGGEIPDLLMATEAQAIARLTVEEPNLLSALAVMEARGDAERMLALANGLGRYWRLASRFRTGRDRLGRAVALPGARSSRWFGPALDELAWMHHLLGGRAAARARWTESLSILEASGDEPALAKTLFGIGQVELRSSRFSEAQAAVERSLVLYERLGDRRRAAVCLAVLGQIAFARGETAEALALNERATTVSREVGDTDDLAYNRMLRGHLLLPTDAEAARAAYRDALALYDEIGDGWDRSQVLVALAICAVVLGDADEAKTLAERAVALASEIGDPAVTADASCARGCAFLAGGNATDALAAMREALRGVADLGDRAANAELVQLIAEIVWCAGERALAARLLGGSRAILDRIGSRQPRVSLPAAARLHAAVRRAPLAVEFAAGAAMPEADLLALAIGGDAAASAGAHPAPTDGEPASPVSNPVRSPAGGDQLTPRELDVLRLVAAGKTNAETGEALFISPFTAKTHVANLLGKLGAESRAAAAAWAARQGLL